MGSKKRYPKSACFCIALPFIAFFGFSLVSVLYAAGIIPHTTPRGAVSYSSIGHRQIAQATEKYRELHGTYPPANHVGHYFGPVTANLTNPIPLEYVSDYVAGDTHFIDPYRREKLFPDDVWGKAYYFHRKGSDRMKGYPPRYFRSADGKLAFLISNGPSWTGVTTVEDLQQFRSDQSYEHIHAGLCHRYYDATNGSKSVGDVIRIISAAETDQWTTPSTTLDSPDDNQTTK